MTMAPIAEVDTREAVAEALGRLGPYIRLSARRLADDDSSLRPDLEQVAAIALWRVDPTRFDGEDENYLRGVVFKRMQNVARNERRKLGGGPITESDLRISSPVGHLKRHAK